MHLRILLLLAVVIAAMAFWGTANGELDSSCETSCGNLTYVFPFGSKEGCYHTPDFLVYCDRSSGQPVPYFREESNVVIRSMSVYESEVEIMMFVATDCYNTTGPVGRQDAILGLGDLRISTKNRFVAIGCDTNALISGDRGTTDVVDYTGSGCISYCGSNMSSITNGTCSGVGCCQVEIPQGMNFFNITVNSINNHTHILDFNNCSYGFVVAPGKYNFNTNDLHAFSQKEMPMLLEWAIGNETCEVARNNTSTNFLCKGDTSECDKEYGGPGYRCRCRDGYAGNPYIENNCIDINECEDGNNGGCEHQCVDIPGSYECRCHKGYKKDGTGCIADELHIIQIVFGTLGAAIFLLIFVAWLYLGLKKRKLIKLKEKFFRQNGGIMLQQRISGERSSHHDQAKIFSIEELKKATNNYDDTRIIGKGGFGTVYKGVLSDNRTVAIKKSKLVDQTQSQIEQFINEVVILSQINHRNVVKLIGCCLETEVPLLVYEFIPNGTLSDHIHNESRPLALTWDIRLRIATETAGALSYLHSAASVPIIHRDIKPTNILLDDNYVAKVSDFGASRLIPMDQIELATVVQGTLGYLDPEYMQTNQLTDKSDVYSFGVVLVELLSGKKALSFDRPEKERNLSMYFLSCLKEGKLLQVLDEHLLLNEATIPNEIINVSRLAERCLRVNGDERPTMKEVAIELEGILATMIQKHPWVSNEEESEYLLKQPMDDSTNTSSITFDSINKHTILPISSGR